MKLPTFWNSNTAKTAGSAYSDATIAYSDATASYSTSGAATDDRAETPSVWTPAAKTATNWQANTAAHSNEYSYDSAILVYDLANQTYDGVATDLDTGNTNTPVSWSAA